jgi:Divergent InlB B-repeat domain
MRAVRPGLALFFLFVLACSGGGGPAPGIDAATDARATDALDDATPIDTPWGEAVLTVVKTGNGRGTVTSSPAGISCGSDCSQAFAGGTTVTLTATPDAASMFTGWTGGACAGTGACAVTVTQAVTVTAQFAPLTGTCTLGVEVQGPGQGRVVSKPGGINCAPDCREQVTCGSTVTLTALPMGGGGFQWSGACNGGSLVCIVVVNQPFLAAIATFR